MRSWCWRLRSFAALHSSGKPHHHHHHHRGYSFCSDRLLHSSSNLLHKPHISSHSVFASYFSPKFNASSFPCHLSVSVDPSAAHHSQAEEKEDEESCKGRFRIMNDGQIRRWKEGKRHNAHSKSKKSKRRLRQPGIVPLAYAKVMKKLNFCG